MAGKPQKPVSQLQFARGGRGERRSFPVVVPDAPLVPPPPPAGLRSLGKEVWAAYWSDPVSCAASPVDGYDIARYCRLVDLRNKYERRMEREGGTQATIIGGERPHGLFGVVKELTREIEKLREQLGILPLARMRLGLVKTQRDLGVADLRRRLDRSDEAREAIESEATEVVDLDALA